MEKIFGIVNEAINISNKLSIEIQDQKVELNLQMEKLLDLYLSSSLSKDILESKMNSLKEHMSEYDLKLAQLSTSAFEEVEVKRIKSHLVELREQLNDAENNVKRTVIDALIHKIVIYPEEIKVIFKIKKHIKKVSDIGSLTKGSNGGDEGSRTPVQIVSSFKRLQFSLIW